MYFSPSGGCRNGPSLGFQDSVSEKYDFPGSAVLPNGAIPGNVDNIPIGSNRHAQDMFVRLEGGFVNPRKVRSDMVDIS